MFRAFVLFALSILLSLPSLAATPLKGVNMIILDGNDGNIAAKQNDTITANRQRLAILTGNGFNLVRARLVVPPDTASPQNAQAAAAIASDFIKGAMALNIKPVIVLFPGKSSDHKAICDTAAQAKYISYIDAVIAVLPDTNKVAFEPMNEPPPGCSPSDSQTGFIFQQNIYDRFRASKHQAQYVVNGNRWGSLKGIFELNPGYYLRDPNVLYTFHYYAPSTFTSQQATFNHSFVKYVSGLSWPTNAANMQASLAVAQQKIQADNGLSVEQKSDFIKKLTWSFSDYTNSGTGQYMSDNLGKVLQWAAQYGIHPDHIFLGEYGVYRPGNYSKERPMASADSWLASVKYLSDRVGFESAVWDLDSNFAVLCDGGTVCAEYKSLK